MKKFFNSIKNIFHNFFWGLKTADEIILQQDDSSIPGSAIVQEVNDKRVSKALLKGEVTQEVEELRYRTYLVDREAKMYEYIAPTLAFKKEYVKDNDNKFITYENSENLEIVTIQPNECNIEGVVESTKDVDFKNATIINEDDDFIVDMGYLKPNDNYTIKLKRDFYPRYKLEKYIKRLVVKKVDDNSVILDFYVSKYPIMTDIKSKGFIREIEKIKNEGLRSDIIKFTNVSFTTLHAYKLVDMLDFKFNNIQFDKIVEYDGNYIIKFQAKVKLFGHDLTDKYYSKTMDEKYKNKVKKEVALDIFNSNPIRVFKCEHCGKEMIYDPTTMDEIDATEARDIDDENEKTSLSTMEFMDAKISYETYGVMLCKDCLKEYLKNNNLI